MRKLRLRELREFVWGHISQSVQFGCSVVSDSLRPMNCSTPGLPVHHQLLEFTQTHIHRVIDAIQPSHPLLSPSPLAPNPSQNLMQKVDSFSNESIFCIRWPKYRSYSFRISPSKEHPGLISFKMDWLDLLAVQGTLKSLLQHHSSKASILRCSAFFTVQLSHPYKTTGSVQFSSVTQTCPTLCDPMNHSMPGLPVHHQLLEFTQTHVHQVGDAI